MANTAQSKKRARQNEKRATINKSRRSRIRTFLRKVEEAISNGQIKNLAKALSTNATVEDMKIAYLGYGITATAESKGEK